MKSKYKPIPIKAAKAISEAYDKNQVIIVTWDKQHGMTHVTTYGKTLEECDQAALGGNLVKRALGWDESLCNSVPNRVQVRLEAEYNKGYDAGLVYASKIIGRERDKAVQEDLQQDERTVWEDAKAMGELMDKHLEYKQALEAKIKRIKDEV